MLNFLPPFIENKQEKIGKVLSLTIPEPGIYRLITDRRGELYVVPLDYEGGAFSRDVFQYGETLDDVAVFEVGKGQYILEYELARRHRADAIEDWEINYYDALLHDFSEAERPFVPQYFGPYLPPLLAPGGAVTRYQSICNGAFLVDSGGRWFVALSQFIALLDFEPFVSLLEPAPVKNNYYFMDKDKFSPVASQLYDLFPGLEAVFPQG